MHFIAYFYILLSSLFIFLSLTSYPYELVEIISTCNLLLQNQSGYFDALTRQPLRQKFQFYLYNVTNGELFSQSDDTIVVDEIGPFAYYGVDSNQTIVTDGQVRSLSLQDLRFSLNESVADESSFLYTLNIQLIRNLTLKSPSLKSPGRNLVHKTTVRDVLREIVDGHSLGTPGVDPFLDTKRGNDDRTIFGELHDDVSSNYLEYLKNEICLRLFRVVQFVNPPTRTLARLFQESPCECVTVTPNGTEKMPRKHGEYPDVLTSKYLFQWNDELCASTPTDPFFPIQQNRSVTEKLFWVSSTAYWRNLSSVRYRPVVEGTHETWIKVEPMSDVLTDFFFEYQLNLPVFFVDDRFSSDVLNVYPVLLTVINGVSDKQVESSIVRFVLNPKERVVTVLQYLGFWVLPFLSLTLYLLYKML